MRVKLAPHRLPELAGQASSLPGPGVVTGASDGDPSGIAAAAVIALPAIDMGVTLLPG
jgi:hypothetical protein